MKVQYKTLGRKTEFLLKEKGSKFIAFAQKCVSEKSVKKILEGLKIAHPQATHICYAYKLGVNKEVVRTNDDGEPNNTAGVPILGQINSFDLNNVCIAVVRYYGGTKLGVGGLVAAYRGAAKGAIEENEVYVEELSSEMQLNVEYDEYPFLMQLLKQKGINIIEQVQKEEVRLTLEIKNSIWKELKEQLGSFQKLKIISEKIST